MKIPAYSRLLNGAWYQLLWFTAILGGSALLPVLLLLLVLHLSLVDRKVPELTLLFGAAAIGIAFDGVLAGVGFYRFTDAGSMLPVPLWLIAIWMGFAGTLRSSLSFLVARPRLMTLATALLAPVTYLGAERLGAVSFAFGTAPTAVVVGLSWWALTPILLRLESITRTFTPSRLIPVAAVHRPEA